MAESSGGLEQTLTKGEIAGVPVWAAGIGMAAVFIGWNWWRSRNNTIAQGPVESFPDTNPADGEPVDTSMWGLPPGPIGEWLAQNPGSGAYPVGWSPRGLPSAITNVQWSRLVSDELLARGSDPTLVANALTKYLSGDPLSEGEQAVINRALQLIGFPPEGLIPVNTGPAAPTTATVSEGQPVNNWLAQINAQYPGLNMTVTQLRLLNPTVKIARADAQGYLSSTNPATGTVIDVFNGNQTVKIR